jgi:opacity protein-like surface antigen
MKSKVATLLRVILAANIWCFINMASAGQLYLGAQATNLSAHLDYGNGSEYYNLNPTRIELGWKERTFYWAIHMLTSGQDTDLDLYGATYEMKMDPSYGIFLGLNTTNFYIGFGLQNFDTTYRLVPGTTQDKSNILTIGVQLGIQQKLAPNLSLYADFSAYAGKADYSIFTSNPDFSVHGFAGGVKYAF